MRLLPDLAARVPRAAAVLGAAVAFAVVLLLLDLPTASAADLPLVVAVDLGAGLLFGVLLSWSLSRRAARAARHGLGSRPDPCVEVGCMLRSGATPSEAERRRWHGALLRQRAEQRRTRLAVPVAAALLLAALGAALALGGPSAVPAAAVVLALWAAVLVAVAIRARRTVRRIDDLLAELEHEHG